MDVGASGRGGGDYDAASTLTVDVGLAYVLDGFNHKYHANHRFEDVDPAGAPWYAAHSIQFGVQYMMSN